MLAFRGLIGACGMLCLYNALGRIPAGNVMSIFAFTPVITMLVSHFALGERATLTEAIGAIIGLVGIVLIAQPDPSASSTSSHLLGSFLALCGSSCASMGYVTVRGMGANVHFTLNIFSLSTFCILGSSVVGREHAISDAFTNSTGRNIVILASLFAFIGQCCLNKGLQMCKAGPGTIMRNIDVPVVYIVAIFVLGETPDTVRLLGSTLVVLSALLVGMSKLFNR
ncbi:EamA-like transporter [Gracilaria domingensis]|nr:EamA-like transporter [Gracilaria domingensis]